MPELPEVECVRLSLSPVVLGRRIASVRVIRPDIVRGDAKPADLLAGDRIAALLRHGKQLAIQGESGRCICIHLGMSGQLCVVPKAVADHARPTTTKRTTEHKRSTKPNALPAHTHVYWELEGGLGLRFTDPRRFGGVWTFTHLDALNWRRWDALGPDALTATPRVLHRGLAGTTRCLKAALLDQHIVAGLGNIYVDELLFGAGLHPQKSANTLSRRQAASLTRRMRTLLVQAIQRGGSSLRDYVDAENRRGNQQAHHRVYGQAGKPCRRRDCQEHIVSGELAGRTTTWCPGCQYR